jgi:hypothetical protein
MNPVFSAAISSIFIWRRIRDLQVCSFGRLVYKTAVQKNVCKVETEPPENVSTAADEEFCYAHAEPRP